MITPEEIEEMSEMTEEELKDQLESSIDQWLVEKFYKSQEPKQEWDLGLVNIFQYPAHIWGNVFVKYHNAGWQIQTVQGPNKSTKLFFSLCSLKTE